MATTPTTTTPSYGLSESTRKAVREAGPRPGEAQRLLNQAQALDAAGDAAVTAGTAVATGLAIKEAREEAQKEEREAEEKRIADLTEEAHILFEEGLEAIPARNGWATPELYDQFVELEEIKRDEYIQKVKDGDRKGAAAALREQRTRAAELEAIKSTMETAAGVNDPTQPGSGWGNKITQNPELLEDLGIISSMKVGDDGKIENPKFSYDESGELIITVTRKNGEVKDYRKQELDKAVAEGIAPSKLRTSSKENLNQVRDNAFAGNVREPNWDDRALDIAASMAEGDIESYFLDPIYDKTNTFVDDFMADENPAWQGDPIPIEGNTELEALDPDGDGKITEDEWELLLSVPDEMTDEELLQVGQLLADDPDISQADAEAQVRKEKIIEIQKTRRLIANEMKNHPKIARKYLSEWIAGIEQQNWIDATQQGIENRIELSANKGGSSSMSNFNVKNQSL